LRCSRRPSAHRPTVRRRARAAPRRNGHAWVEAAGPPGACDAHGALRLTVLTVRLRARSAPRRNGHAWVEAADPPGACDAHFALRLTGMAQRPLTALTARRRTVGAWS